MDYYIMQQTMWAVTPNEETETQYLEAYEQIFIGKDVAEYYLNIGSKTNDEISNIINTIKNTDLKDIVVDTLNQIKEMYPNSAIMAILIFDEDTCVIIYDFLIKAIAIDTITITTKH